MQAKDGGKSNSRAAKKRSASGKNKNDKLHNCFLNFVNNHEWTLINAIRSTGSRLVSTPNNV